MEKKRREEGSGMKGEREKGKKEMRRKNERNEVRRQQKFRCANSKKTHIVCNRSIILKKHSDLIHSHFITQ